MALPTITIHFGIFVVPLLFFLAPLQFCLSQQRYTTDRQESLISKIIRQNRHGLIFILKLVESWNHRAFVSIFYNSLFCMNKRVENMKKSIMPERWIKTIPPGIASNFSESTSKKLSNNTATILFMLHYKWQFSMISEKPDREKKSLCEKCDPTRKCIAYLIEKNWIQCPCWLLTLMSVIPKVWKSSPATCSSRNDHESTYIAARRSTHCYLL